MLGITLKDTVGMMNSADYKERFIAEYWQTKIRYEKLKTFNNKIDAAFKTMGVCPCEENKHVEMPVHDCPAEVLREQLSIMGKYLHVMEVRAVIEGIDLDVPFKCCCGESRKEG